MKLLLFIAVLLLFLETHFKFCAVHGGMCN